MNKGKVNFYNSVKSFGFILGEDGKDVYVRNVELNDGDTVEYSVNGNEAVNVKIVDTKRQKLESRIKALKQKRL